MSILEFANNAVTTLAAGISSSATSCSLAAGTGALFPNPGAGQYFLLSFTDAATGLLTEIVQVTARVTDTLTIVRGQEGTTARAWLAADNARNLWTAGSAAAMVQVAQLQIQATNYAADTGAANAYVVTLSPVPSSLASITGSPIRVKITNTSTGASTLNVNGLGATVIQNMDGTALVNGQLPAAAVAEFVYNGSVFQLVSPTAYELLAKANTWAQTQTLSSGAISTGNDAGAFNYRFTYGGYGSGFRIDNSYAYWMLTNNGSPNGSYNSLRPMTIALSNGALTFDGTGAGSTFDGTLTAQGYSYLNAGATVNTSLSVTGTTYLHGNGEIDNSFSVGGLLSTGFIYASASSNIIIGSSSSANNPVLSGYNGFAVDETQLQIYGPSNVVTVAASGSTGSSHMVFYGGSVNVQGSITVAGPGSVNFNTTSDERLKQDEGLISADQASSILMKLKPRWFRWLADLSADPEPGFFAQQLHRAFKWGAVKGKGKPGDKEFMPWQTSPSRLIPILVAHNQDLERRLRKAGL